MVNLPIEYSDKPVTPFGGMSLMKRFLDQTTIKEYLGTLELHLGQLSEEEAKLYSVLGREALRIALVNLRAVPAAFTDSACFTTSRG